MLYFFMIGLENQPQVQQHKTMGFTLHLICFDSCKIPGLIIHVDAVKMQAEGREKERHVTVRTILTASQRSLNFFLRLVIM